MKVFIKFLQVFLLMLATVLMGAAILIIKNSSIIDMIAPGYFLVVNGFLGIDLWIMIKETKKLPGMEFKDLHWYRYITALLCMLALTVLSTYMMEVHDIQALIASSSFILGDFAIIGMILAGIKGNKLVSV